MPKMFFAPDGSPITSASAFSFSSPNIEVDPDAGTAGLGHFDDFPGFEAFELPGLGACIMDNDGSDWLEQHCRLIEVDDDYDVWSTDAEAPAWDEHIVVACARVQHLGQTLWCAERLRLWSPPDIRDDPTINGVLNHIIVGRAQAEIDTLQAQIAAYRVGRVEITKLETVPGECETCAESDRTRLLPCDECGAVDVIEDEDTLLELAEQKHAAQMMDLDPELAAQVMGES